MTLADFIRLTGIGVLCLILGFGFYYHLGAYALLNNNEGLYAQIPLEMLKSGNFVIPTLNGNPYIEKPPLLYWLITLSYKLFGVSEGSARFVTATAGLLTCLTSGLFLKEHKHPRAAWLFPLFLGTSVGFIIFSRMVYFDVILTLFFTVSLFSFYTWVVREEKRWLYISYGALGLAVLTKGFLALVLGILIVFLFFLTDRTSFKKVRKFFSPGPVFFFLLVATPWHILAHLQEERFSWFYFVNEHVLRFLDMREPRDYYHGPIYYYIPRLLGYIFPWTLFLGLLARKRTPTDSPKLLKFLWIWFACVLAFFSLSQAKANYYIVLAMPPLLALLAIKIEPLVNRPRNFLLVGITTVMMALLCGAITTLYFFDFHPQVALFKGQMPWSPLLYIGICGGIGLLALWFLRKKGEGPLLLLGTFSVALYMIVLTKVSQFEDKLSTKNLVRQIPEIVRHTPDRILLYRDFEKLSTVPFYVGHPVPIVESHSHDLHYARANPHQPRLFMDMTAFEQRIHAQPPLYVIARDKYEEELKEKGLKVIFRQEGCLLAVSSYKEN